MFLGVPWVFLVCVCVVCVWCVCVCVCVCVYVCVCMCVCVLCVKTYTIHDCLAKLPSFVLLVKRSF